MKYNRESRKLIQLVKTVETSIVLWYHMTMGNYMMFSAIWQCHTYANFFTHDYSEISFEILLLVFLRKLTKNIWMTVHINVILTLKQICQVPADPFFCCVFVVFLNGPRGPPSVTIYLSIHFRIKSYFYCNIPVCKCPLTYWITKILLLLIHGYPSLQLHYRSPY